MAGSRKYIRAVAGWQCRLRLRACGTGEGCRWKKEANKNTSSVTTLDYSSEL